MQVVDQYQLISDTLVLLSGAPEVATLFDLLKGSDSIGSTLSNVQIAGISFQCNPVILIVTSQLHDSSYALIPDVLQAQILIILLAIESSFKLSLTFSDFLLLAGDPVELEMTHSHDGFQIRSDFGILSISNSQGYN